MWYRRLLLALCLGALLITPAPACAPKTITTPAARAAYTADQVVIRVNELQNAAIQANATGALSTDLTRVIVQFAVSADQTLKAAPSGWQATVLTGWQAAKAQLPATLNPSVAAAVQALDALLGVAAGGGL